MTSRAVARLCLPVLAITVSLRGVDAQQSSSTQCVRPSDVAAGDADAVHWSDWITDLDALQRITTSTRSSSLRLAVTDVRVAEVTGDGFWISTDDDRCRLFVIPAEGDLIRVHRGKVVSLQGEIRLRVQGVARTATAPAHQPYLYAYVVRPAW